MGDRVEGTYNVVTLNKHATTDLYYLRHYQNRPGGFNGVGRLVTNSYGSRWFGPIAHGFRYTAEGVVQTGEIGLVPHRAYAWVVQAAREVTLLRKPLDFRSSTSTHPAVAARTAAIHSTPSFRRPMTSWGMRTSSGGATCGT